jgi:hypothetical protein
MAAAWYCGLWAFISAGGGWACDAAESAGAVCGFGRLAKCAWGAAVLEGCWGMPVLGSAWVIYGYIVELVGV